MVINHLQTGMILQVGSMYGLFTYIDHKNQTHVGKCASPMDHNFNFGCFNLQVLKDRQLGLWITAFVTLSLTSAMLL